MRFERGLLAACWMICACGPVVGDDERVCGKEGPVRLLRLEADESVGPSGITRIDDRYYTAVGRAVHNEDDYGIPSLEIEQSRVASFRTCGEAPRIVALDVPHLFQDHDHFPGALLGRSENDDEVVIDLAGASKVPKLLAPALPGFSLHTDVGVLGVIETSPDSSVGTLTLQPYAAPLGEPAPPRVALLEGVVTTAFSFTAHGTGAIARTESGALEAIDLTSGNITTIADDVSAFDVTRDGNSVVFVQAAMTGYGPATLLDRTTGTETLLADDASAVVPGVFGDEIVLERDTGNGVSQRVIVLPELTSWDLPPGLTFTHRTDDGTVLARREQNRLVRYDVDTGTETVLFDGFVMSTIYGDDAAEVFVPAGSGVFFEVSGELWRVPYSGDPPQQIAARVGGIHQRLDDGRIVTLVDLDDGDVGTLLVIDPDTHEERVLDENVYVQGLLAGPPPVGQPDIIDDGLVIYDVRDGDRSGIWLAKP